MFADNLYSAVQLVEWLHIRGILFTGTIRKNRVPGDVKQDVVTKSRLPQVKRTIKRASKGKVVVASIYDSKPVYMISSAHEKVELTTVERIQSRRQDDGSWARLPVDVEKLNRIADYNQFMNAVDRADELRVYYSVRVRSRKWWHAIFWWCVDSAISNAYIIHKELPEERSLPKMTHSKFCGVPAEQLVAGLEMSKRGSDSFGKRRHSTSEAVQNPPPDRAIGCHWPAKIDGPGSSP